ncbi:HDOD domain-containing protein [Candidatus Sumerlaeota bacterium]|nr:HDOD domain-containing protein [Candidatus Sumerlaeota bacterium]
MISREILRNLLDVEDLPTLPQVVARIVDTAGDEKSSAQDLTAVLEGDHAISARVLRFANSPFYGLPSQVDSIRRAVVLIGFDTVKMLALATSVFGVLGSRVQSAFDAQDFWMHSFGAAKAAQILAQRVGPVESPETCFTGGLLHDIGKYVLGLYMGEGYGRICTTARTGGRPLREVEYEQIQTTHAEIGGWIASHWRFPPIVTTMILRQYECGTYRGPHAKEVGIAYLANVLSRLAGFGYASDPKVQPTQGGLANSLGLGTDAVVGIAQELQASKAHTLALLHLLSRP